MDKQRLESYTLGISATVLLFILIALTQVNRVEAVATQPAPEVVPVSLPAPPKVEFKEEQPEQLSAEAIVLHAPDTPPQEAPLSPVDIKLHTALPDSRIKAGHMIAEVSIDTPTTNGFIEAWELDELPTLVKEGDFKLPKNNQRYSKEMGHAEVEVSILPNGELQLLRILECSHPKYASAVEAFVNSSQFSNPTASGRPVSARYVWKIKFPLN